MKTPSFVRRALAGLSLLALALLVATPAAAVESPARRGHARPSTVAATGSGPASTADKEPTGRGRGKHVLRGVVNLNQADQETLELLPGVGESTALKIISYRAKRPFKRIEDLTRVKGIGKKKLARMKPFLAVTGPSTLVEEDAAGPEGDGAE